ncbi:MAG: class II fructose-bisphosphate aldolase, partial [Ruminococcaceae bacterium]|nr:class II fructose-bisphosphate aldolase [Oscillospiraceae bacterium]
MLVSFKEILAMAEKGDFAIPAFNVYNMETVIGVFNAAQKAHAPVIMQIYPRLIKEQAGYFLAPSVLAAAAKADVPVCFHLDHGPSELEMTRALRYGATGIMIDASSLPYEENIALTRRVVETCAYDGVQVEGELGHVGSVNDDSMDEFTNVEEAKNFVEKTGVAALAAGSHKNSSERAQK